MIYERLWFRVFLIGILFVGINRIFSGELYFKKLDVIVVNGGYFKSY